MTFGTRPNPFSKAQLIEAQLAKIDMAQAELFRTIKQAPAGSTSLCPQDLEPEQAATVELDQETALHPSPPPGLRRSRDRSPAGHSRAKEMRRIASEQTPEGIAQPQNLSCNVNLPQEKSADRKTGGPPAQNRHTDGFSLPPSHAERPSPQARATHDGPAEFIENAAPHYLGHRERLRQRFLKGGTEALADYELLELILFRAMPRRDVKPLAKDLIIKFGSFAQVIAARPERLQEIQGLGAAAITEIKIIEAAARRLAKSNIEKRPSMGSFTAVVDYCRTAMAFLDHEEFRVLFLDKKNFLIADEVQGIGTVDHAPVYTREIIRRALELSASAIILVHNHPSGDPQPSTEDIYLTHQIIDIAKKLNVVVHDHLIIGKHGHASLKGMRII